MNRLRILGTVFAVILVIAVAGATRWKAVTTLNIDYDEDDYLRAAQEYTAIFRSGDLSNLLETNYRSEHPPFAKIVLGAALLGDPEKPLTPDRPTSAQPNQFLPRDLLKSGRVTNAAFSVLTTALLALVNPLAGLLLAVHAWTIKYVSQIMLEAIPAFTSLVSVLAYGLWKKRQNESINGWLIVSAIFLGITAASKYIYVIVGVAILADWLIETSAEGEWKKTARNILTWSIVALILFFVFDPYLWPDPTGRLKDSILYHSLYSQGAAEVESANFPIWQQFVWLSTSPLMWQRDVFYLSIDPIIALLAMIGLGSTWKENRVFALWLIIGLFFLLIWPTKWPQYLVTISTPLCLSASKGADTLIIRPVRKWILTRRNARHIKAVRQKSDIKQAVYWLIPGLLAFLILTILPLIYQVGVSMTDFNSVSIKDGLAGGIWREVSGGITGKIAVELQEFPYRSKIVHYLGLSNFGPLFNYLSQQQVLFNNISWTIVSVALQTFLGLLTAMVLWQRGVKLKKVWQALFILPWAIPELIGALMWFNVFAPGTGWLSLAAEKFGPEMPFYSLIGWQNNPNLSFLILLISGVWYGFPFMMLASSAGLKMMPIESYDAAQIDGASGIQTFRYVTWPLLYPLLAPAIIIRGIFAFNQFYLFQAFDIRDGTLATLSFNFFNPTGFYINGQFAISAVINIFTIGILIIFVVLFNRWSKAGEGVTYA